jgi:transglutaminase-like putative cysteine protease
MSAYLQVPTRTGVDGAKDKAAAIYALASWTAQTNRDFLNKVREVVNGCDSAESQVDRWFDYCASKTYTREFGDVFSHPSDTLKHGGDCDDLTILLLAGIMALGIPACPDVVMRNGNGVHVRVKVGLPPHAPPADLTKWKVLDPSKDSEGKWVGANKTLYAPKTVSYGFGAKNASGNLIQLNGLHGDSPQETNWKPLIAIAIAAAAGFYLFGGEGK